MIKKILVKIVENVFPLLIVVASLRVMADSLLAGFMTMLWLSCAHKAGAMETMHACRNNYLERFYARMAAEGEMRAAIFNAGRKR